MTDRSVSEIAEEIAARCVNAKHYLNPSHAPCPDCFAAALSTERERARKAEQEAENLREQRAALMKLLDKEQDEAADKLEAAEQRAERFREALEYILGKDVAGYDAHMRPEEVAKRALQPDTEEEK